MALKYWISYKKISAGSVYNFAVKIWTRFVIVISASHFKVLFLLRVWPERNEVNLEPPTGNWWPFFASEWPWVFGFDKLLICFGIFFFNGFLVDFVLFWISTDTWTGTQAVLGPQVESQSDLGGLNVFSLQYICVLARSGLQGYQLICRTGLEFLA